MSREHQHDAGLLSRRALLGGIGCACCAGVLGTGEALARIAPKSMNSLVGPGYKPVDRDERGLWQQYDRFEEEVAGSNLRMNDPAMQRYLGGLAERVGGPAARDLRVYLVRVPEFNAFMTPTGFMVVFSGLLTRMRNEAQLSGVIAHEAGHYLRKHQIRAYRDTKQKANAFAVLAMAAGVGGAGAGVYLGDAVQLAQLGTILSLFDYSRELEAEADAIGLRNIAETGYEPMEMSRVWEQLIAETEASARVRNKRPRRGGSLLATHPAPRERMRDLRASAAEVTQAGRSYEDGRARYQSALAPHRAMLLDDQIKLNDPGASLYIIENLAKDGWNGLLRFYEAETYRLRGRPEDLARAVSGYAQAVRFPDAPAEAWRQHGYAQIKAGRPAEGRQALQTYLAKAPNAPDAKMVRFSLAQ